TNGLANDQGARLVIVSNFSRLGISEDFSRNSSIRLGLNSMASNSNCNRSIEYQESPTIARLAIASKGDSSRSNALFQSINNRAASTAAEANQSRGQNKAE
ncbi:hypothetical protein U1Q18_027706, partial [Sarracenia purpurea var. burkii]